MQKRDDRPGRPLGVVLAIAVSVLLYSILPLMLVGQVLLIEQHFNRMEPVIPIDGETVVPIISGGDLRGGITDWHLILQSALAVGFLLLAVAAWRGRPPLMRFVFSGTVILLTVFTLLPMFWPGVGGSQDLSGGSLDDALRSLGFIRAMMYIVVPVYVVWYLNRGPARAFFRGHYLPFPDAR
jgi:hypothetical protein